jgi:hypothetical protein
MAFIVIIRHSSHACDLTLWLSGASAGDWSHRYWDPRDVVPVVEEMLGNGHKMQDPESLVRVQNDCLWMSEHYPRRKRA